MLTAYQKRDYLLQWWSCESRHDVSPCPALIERVGDGLRRDRTEPLADEEWARLYREVRLGLDAQRVEQPASAEPRITISLTQQRVTFDGTVHDVSSPQALRWLEVLTQHEGDWISGAELERHDFLLLGARPDKLLKKLPEPIRKLIDSKRGTGHRLNLPST